MQLHQVFIPVPLHRGFREARLVNQFVQPMGVAELNGIIDVMPFIVTLGFGFGFDLDQDAALPDDFGAWVEPIEIRVQSQGVGVRSPFVLELHLLQASCTEEVAARYREPEWLF